MSDLIFEKKEKLDLIPEVIGYLASIKEFEYSYKDYNLRHPGGVYNLGTHYVINDFIELLKELEEHQTNFDESRNSELEKKFQLLVHDLMKFYDSCAEIIMGCCKKHEDVPKKHFWDWLKKHGYKASSEKIYLDTKDELDLFRDINNRLKHTSNRFRQLYFIKGNSATMGFWIEAAFNDGSIGPDEKIHPSYQGRPSASSYNFILRKLYYVFYKISFVLNEVIINHFNEVYDIDLRFNNDYPFNDADKTRDEWRELNEMMKELPRAYFPNESGEQTFKFEEIENKLIFTAIRAESLDMNESRIILKPVGDSFTRIFKCPFYK